MIRRTSAVISSANSLPIMPADETLNPSDQKVYFFAVRSLDQNMANKIINYVKAYDPQTECYMIVFKKKKCIGIEATTKKELNLERIEACTHLQRENRLSDGPTVDEIHSLFILERTRSRPSSEILSNTYAPF